VIADRGRAFDFLTWYRPLTIVEGRTEKPSFDSLRGDVLWRLERPGTCSSSHFKKLALEKLGAVQVDQERLRRDFPERMRPGDWTAVSDVSIANRMFTLLPGSLGGRTPAAVSGCPTIRGGDVLQ